ncbi:hypothetical protein [Haloferax sulfurifontis]|uniref:DUF7979 domain-containing protein n=1 Tax=Haloferax sulfurifontis ATCC BAA-897 TaxID=662480 RepID=M0IR85_9EURY|nr:hypothetical protein [Haloferax sulfurifontis]ELZ99376.1 hypothetical protein C441_00600 [Haloferax sulfurifontis ATCC BAA-897]
MSPELSRRSLLGGLAVGSALLSGCLGGGLAGSSCPSSYSLEATALSDPELVDTVTQDFHEHADTVSNLVATAANEGEATYSTYRHLPLDSGDYVEHDGAYYRVERERTETRERTAREVGIEYDRNESPPTGATVFDFAELPKADREAFLAAYPSENFENGDGPRGFSVGGYAYVYPDGADSRLIDAGTVWVRYGGRPFEVTVGETRTVEEETFRYTLEQVGEDRAAFAAFVHEELVVPLDDLSDAERAVFERAIEGEVDECEPLSDDFAALKDRLYEISENRATSHGPPLVEYEGTTYEVDLVNAVV